MDRLEEILAGYAPEDADQIRAAMEADKAEQATVVTEPVAVEPVVEPVVEPTVDVSAEVDRSVAAAMSGLRSDIAKVVEEATAPVAESNAKGTSDLVDEVVAGVQAAFESRFEAIEVAAEKVNIRPAGVLAGAKPIDGVGATEGQDAAEEKDLAKLAEDSQSAPTVLARALRRYEERNGPYVPSDAPRVHVSMEHLQLLQGSRVPGETFHFDYGSAV